MLIAWDVMPVWEGNALVAGDDAVVDGEDGLGVHPHPGHLYSTPAHFTTRDGEDIGRFLYGC